MRQNEWQLHNKNVSSGSRESILLNISTLLVLPCHSLLAFLMSPVRLLLLSYFNSMNSMPYDPKMYNHLFVYLYDYTDQPVVFYFEL